MEPEDLEAKVIGDGALDEEGEMEPQPGALPAFSDDDELSGGEEEGGDFGGGALALPEDGPGDAEYSP